MYLFPQTGLCFTVLDNPHKRTEADLVDKITGYLDTDTVLFPVEVRDGRVGGTESYYVASCGSDMRVVIKVAGM